MERARQFPGQEQRGLGLLPQQSARRSPALRAPIFEDKVIDFLLELAKVTDKKVSREELYQGRRDRPA